MSDPEAERLKAEIEKTREDLASTVDQLTSRLDTRKQQAKTGLTYAGAAVGAALAVLVVVKIVQRVRS